MSVGPLEIIIILAIALLVFGPNRLPQAGRSLGEALRELRKITTTAREELGLDEVANSVNDLRSSLSLGLDLTGSDGAAQAGAGTAGAVAAAEATAVPPASTVHDATPSAPPVAAPGAPPAPGAPAAPPAEPAEQLPTASA